MAETELTDKQAAWLERYLVTLNATEAARGVYDTEDYATLRHIGSENLAKPKLRAEIDRRLRELLCSPEDVLAKLQAVAFSDIGPFIGEDGLLDIHKLVDAGLGFLVTEIAPTRGGVRYRLADPLVAIKMLARYHKLLSDHLDVTIGPQPEATKEALVSLTRQLEELRDQGDQGGG